MKRFQRFRARLCRGDRGVGNRGRRGVVSVVTEYLAYELPPADVSAAIQVLVATCHHWPRTNLRELEPIPMEDAQTQTACALAENEFSSTPPLWFGAGIGVTGLIAAFVAWRVARAVVRLLFPRLHHAA